MSQPSPAPAALANGAAATPLGERHPLRILLAEDNAVNQKLALRLLSQMSYDAEVAGDGQQAIDALERDEFDVVLMDVQMPELDGLEATRRIRAQWPDRPLKIVAMTANAMAGDREACLAAGMDDYLSKPIRASRADGGARAGATARRPEAQGRGRMSEPDVPTLDEGVLTELMESTGGDIGFVRELVETYLADTPAQLEAMTTAVEADDADALVRPAHTLKSSSATVGAMRLSSVARELEMAGRTGTLEASVRGAPGRRPRRMERGRSGLRRVARGSIGAMTANGTALVVDDSAVNRLVLVRRLETLGLEVIQAENGRQALDDAGHGARSGGCRPAGRPHAGARWLRDARRHEGR